MIGPVTSVEPTGAPAVLSLDEFPVVRVTIDSLDLDGSPRQGGEDLEHARVLAGIREELPAITVRRQTMQVIDGRHRIRAARLNGHDTIEARLVDCDEATAFALAVRENVAHGLPLSLADRRTAAAAMISAQPHWSDRVVAEYSGLSDKTVSALRAAQGGDHGSRLGRDGRTRPLNSAAMRRKAAELLRADPGAGLRSVARSTGLSLATVRDVRIRIDNGRDPVPARYHDANVITAEIPRQRRTPRAEPIDRRTLLGQLMRDPSVKFSEGGRGLLRWLDRHALDPANTEAIVVSIPARWAMPVAGLARNCALAWNLLADELERRGTTADELDDGTLEA
jgi:ParB-like chromosome segregation protein Spo0J